MDSSEEKWSIRSQPTSFTIEPCYALPFQCICELSWTFVRKVVFEPKECYSVCWVGEIHAVLCSSLWFVSVDYRDPESLFTWNVYGLRKCQFFSLKVIEVLQDSAEWSSQVLHWCLTNGLSILNLQKIRKLEFRIEMRSDLQQRCLTCIESETYGK